MEIRRVGDALLRSHIFPLTFLTPSISSRCQSTGRRTPNSSHRRQLQRSFISSTRSAARSASMTTSASPSTEDANKKTSPKTTTPLDWLVGSGTSRTSRFSSLEAQADDQATSTKPSPLEMLMNKGNSANDLLSALSAARPDRPSKGLDIDRMSEPATSAELVDMMKDINKGINVAPGPVRTLMRLTPSTGRTVFITPRIDVGRGFRLLEQSVGRNKIKSSFNSQRFYERPGLKRKRLKSLRWRKRFMIGFRAAVNRVRQLKKQGW